MQVILYLFLWLSGSTWTHVQRLLVSNFDGNLVALQLGERLVFDSEAFGIASVTIYPNQILFAVLDGQGQHVTVTLTGKGISSRRPTEVLFRDPGLFHGYSDKEDAFFLSFGKFDEARAPGQIKYDLTFPQNIMDGKLTLVNWTDEDFEIGFEGKLGDEKAVTSPDSWVSFSGKIKSKNYQLYRM